MAHPLSKLPRTVVDNMYAEVTVLSGTGTTLASGVSGVFIPSIEGFSIILWGLACIAMDAHSTKHIVIQLQDEDENVYAIGHSSHDDNLYLIFPRPVKLMPGKDVLYYVINSDMGASERTAHTVWYNYIKD